VKRICLLVLATACSVAYGFDAKSDLQAKYDEMAAATVKGDIKPYDELLAKDYVYREGNDTCDRTESLKNIQKQLSIMENPKWVRKVTEVKQSDGAFVATVKSVLDCDMNTGGQRYHSWNSNVFKDTWIQDSGNRWILKSSEMLAWDAKINGQLVKHFRQK
jgi:hypothetical protein